MEAAAAPQPILAALGARRDPLTGTRHTPDETTMRRALGRLDGDALDAAVGAWLTDRLHTQRNHATFLVACKQPCLHAQLLATSQTAPWQLAGYLRGHWTIEDGLHWVRDATFTEDASQVCIGTTPGYGDSAQPRRRRAAPRWAG